MEANSGFCHNEPAQVSSGTNRSQEGIHDLNLNMNQVVGAVSWLRIQPFPSPEAVLFPVTWSSI